MKNTLLLIGVLLLQFPLRALPAAVVIVPAPAGSEDATPTLTLLYAVADPQLTLVVIPGGEGKLGLKESSIDTRNPTTLMAARLTRGDLVKVRMNVVAMDTPNELYPQSLRAEPAHLKRIASVVEYFRQRYSRSVWLLGHSAGTLSVSEYLRKKQAESPVAGAILSGSPYTIKVPDEIDIPLLFLHHGGDECRVSPASRARDRYEEARRINKAPTEFLLVTGGESHGEPCRDGKHMYFRADEEAARLLGGFIEKAVHQ